MPPTGGVHMSGTSETGSTATEHLEIQDNGLCMQHCQGRAGNRAPTGGKLLLFTAVEPLVMAFLPHGRRAAHSKNVPCRPHAPGTDQHHNKRNACTQQIRLRERPLRRQGTNAEQTNQEATNTTAHQQDHHSGRDVTMNRPHAHRRTPSWQGVHGPVREQRPTSWRHCGEPRPPTTMATNTEEHCDSTAADAANKRSQATLHDTCTNQDATNRHRHERAGYTGSFRR